MQILCFHDRSVVTSQNVLWGHRAKRHCITNYANCKRQAPQIEIENQTDRHKGEGFEAHTKRPPDINIGATPFLVLHPACAVGDTTPSPPPQRRHGVATAARARTAARCRLRGTPIPPTAAWRSGPLAGPRVRAPGARGSHTPLMSHALLDEPPVLFWQTKTTPRICNKNTLLSERRYRVQRDDRCRLRPTHAQTGGWLVRSTGTVGNLIDCSGCICAARSHVYVRQI